MTKRKTTGLAEWMNTAAKRTLDHLYKDYETMVTQIGEDQPFQADRTKEAQASVFGPDWFVNTQFERANPVSNAYCQAVVKQFSTPGRPIGPASVLEMDAAMRKLANDPDTFHLFITMMPPDLQVKFMMLLDIGVHDGQLTPSLKEARRGDRLE